ncbi:uncharacterized protein LOC131934578 [Physella acuta]|uniref:uncharacterized protein LOC131934578 n=1 Tax=Physella acuta TaxID=109671 RepID=UPI0027DC136C|nr:uncharacterized protein LOC131934578 [Physella acuta]
MYSPRTIFLFILNSFAIGHGLHISATPTEITTALTATLEVTCQVSANTSHPMESLISLIITRTSSGRVEELATISSLSPGKDVIVSATENLTAFGEIDMHGESYIRLVWEFPEAEIAGVYTCEANGFTHTWHPVIFNASILVSEVYLDLSILDNHLQNLTIDMDHLKQNLSKLEKKQGIWSERLEKMQRLLFKISAEYEGHSYLLSYGLKDLSVESAAATCGLFGGYLVEIDSAHEHQFLIDFLTDVSKNVNIVGVMTGLSDEQQEDVWVNRHSQTVANYTRWLPTHPDGGRGQNCVVLFHPTWLMIDDPCSLSRNDDFQLNYLCELPDTR